MEGSLGEGESADREFDDELEIEEFDCSECRVTLEGGLELKRKAASVGLREGGGWREEEGRAAVRGRGGDMSGGRGGDREAAIGGRGRGGDTVGEPRCLGDNILAVCWEIVSDKLEVWFVFDPSLSKNCPTRRKHSAGIVLMGAGYSGELYTPLPVSGSDMTLDASCLQVGHTVVVTSQLIVPKSQISTQDL